MSLTAKQRMLRRAAADIKHGMTVNLGIGLPTQVLEYVPHDLQVCLHSENGIAGVGPKMPSGKEDRNLIDAGGDYVSVLPGASFFDSSVSFALVRRGRLDLTLLGAFEVAANGDLANWKIPGRMVKGMGGAMDLVASAENIIVAMMHTNKKGESKLLKQCSLPLTGVQCVKKIVTNLALLEVTPNDGFRLLERAPGVTVEEIQAATEGRLIVEGDIPEMNIG